MHLNLRLRYVRRLQNQARRTIQGRELMHKTPDAMYLATTVNASSEPMNSSEDSTDVPQIM